MEDNISSHSVRDALRLWNGLRFRPKLLVLPEGR